VTPSPAHNRTDPHVYGDGITAKTPIEGAARQGYLDGYAHRPFSPEYDAAIPQWQRNYETGRQWAIGIQAIGLEPTEWPEGARTPAALLTQLAEVHFVTGSGTRPEDTALRPADDPTPLHAVVPILRRGRVIKRITP
jgi:hypothetical protein